MDCLLVRPPFEHTGFDQDFQESLGTAYLLSALREKGLSASLIDGELQGLSTAEIANLIQKLKPEVLGFSIMAEYALNGAAEIASLAGTDPVFSPHITAGGYLPSFSPEAVFEAVPRLDSIIQFEGETVLPELVRNTLEGKPFITAGITTRADKGTTARSEPGGYLHDLNMLPPPHRDALPLILGKGLPATISSSRGCTGGCTFCSVREFSYLSCRRPLRQRSSRSVADELIYLNKTFGADTFHFIDDDFIGNRGSGYARARELADLIIEANLSIVFYFECRPDLVDRKLFESLKNAGLAGVFLGIDSAVERTRSLYNKSCSMEDIRRSISAVRDLGLFLDTGFIPFHPDVSFEEIESEYEFLFENDLDNIHTLLNRLYCTDESVLSKRLKEEGLLRQSGAFEFSYEFTDIRVARYYETASVTLKPLFPLWYDIYKMKHRTANAWLTGRGGREDFTEQEKKLRQANLSVRTAVKRMIEYIKTEEQGDLLAFTREIRESLREQLASGGEMQT